MTSHNTQVTMLQSSRAISLLSFKSSLWSLRSPILVPILMPHVMEFFVQTRHHFQVPSPVCSLLLCNKPLLIVKWFKTALMFISLDSMDLAEAMPWLTSSLRGCTQDWNWDQMHNAFPALTVACQRNILPFRASLGLSPSGSLVSSSSFFFIWLCPTACRSFSSQTRNDAGPWQWKF